MKLPSSCEWTASYRSASDPADRGQREREVERNLGQRRTDADAPDERRPQAPEDAQPRQRDVAPERIGDEVDGVPEIEQGADAVVFAERGAPGLEERLRRNHEDFHRSEPGNCRKAEPKGQRKSRHLRELRL